eukprot:1156671-Pelagomonas_calceolata.AAC.3
MLSLSSCSITQTHTVGMKEGAEACKAKRAHEMNEKTIQHLTFVWPCLWGVTPSETTALPILLHVESTPSHLWVVLHAGWVTPSETTALPILLHVESTPSHLWVVLHAGWVTPSETTALPILLHAASTPSHLWVVLYAGWVTPSAEITARAPGPGDVGEEGACTRSSSSSICKHRIRGSGVMHAHVFRQTRKDADPRSPLSSWPTHRKLLWN